MHTPYTGTVGMLLYINGKFTMGKLKSFVLSLTFVLNLYLLSISMCRFKIWSRLSLIWIKKQVGEKIQS
jgi:hypothetical protein